MNDIGRLAILFSEFRQLRVNLPVLDSPNLAVLGFENVVLRIVNDISCRGRTGNERQDAHEKCGPDSDHVSDSFSTQEISLFF